MGGRAARRDEDWVRSVRAADDKIKPERGAYREGGLSHDDSGLAV